MPPIDRPAVADAPAARRGRVRTPLPESFTHRLHTLQKLTDKVTQDAYLAATGLPLGEGRCLSAVGAFAPLSVKDLAQRANVDKAQASRAAQALVDKGLVEKTASATDARGVVLRFTPEGQRLWRRLMAVIEARNQQIVACLSDAERAQFDRILTRLVAHARDVAQQGG
ncbi:MarR family transcriptional regulator [Ottowia sp.]|uniref:MarR family winged helix-turn-helix transcriptional regulator n=1 Tax=Ottowia sp. TaxID=1898956 RepID=UPI002C5D5CC0|nr:MarR family transcriptional regulator [Ottowia sp.]HOB67020.1 MarR family transcriptional regulator [Ottowia sp.]HQD49333.1 MarR family transcriptional regulator [Ottowia sp.]